MLLALGLLGLYDLGDGGWRWLAVDVVWAIAGGLAIAGALGALIGKLVLYLRTRHQEPVGLDEFLALGLIAIAYGVAQLSLPRGIRLCNPGNIERTSVRWKGMASVQRDPRFITFVSAPWGIRAMARILLGDWREGQDTIASIIHEWAPPSENDTDAYVRAVAGACGVDPSQPCNVPALLPRMIAAMIRHENGIQPYPPKTIRLGIDLEWSA